MVHPVTLWRTDQPGTAPAREPNRIFFRLRKPREGLTEVRRTPQSLKGLYTLGAFASVADAWVSLVNPKDYFDGVNVSIHGINESKVKHSPTWETVLPEVNSRLGGRIVVCHTPFDRLALARACDRANLSACECTWLDSARVVRRAWPQFSKSGYGLSNVAEHFAIEYKAHDALEDARCAGLLLLRAIADTGLTVEQWLVRVEQPIDPQSRHGYTAKRDGNPDGNLFGEVLVFTGALMIPRREAADAAAAAGCRVEDGVTKHTTILVVGDQDIRRLAGHEKSSKHVKAEMLIGTGQRIRILGENDFERLVLEHSGACVSGAHA